MSVVPTDAQPCNEKLLSDLLNENTSDISPQSRNEAFLLGLIDNVVPDITPVSRVECYLKALCEKNTGTDAVINEDGHLIITLSTGKQIDAGYAVGPSGADGKSAYQYAVEGGYTKNETAFAEKLAQEQLSGMTNELTPTQVYNAVSAGIPVKVQYFDDTYGIISFTEFAVAESLNVIASNIITYYNGVYILYELFGDKSSNRWSSNVTTLAQQADIPDIPAELPNPNALTFTGAVTGSYDGSNAKTVNIPSAVTDDHINSLIDAKLGVIENGSY